jgi:ribonuclease VapC
MDSWSVIAYLEDERSAEKIAEIIGGAHESGVPLLMTGINAGEVWYTIARESSEEDADQSIKDIADLGVTILDADWNLTLEAARFKAKGRIAYADCFAAALARQRGFPLVTGDPEFKRLERDVSIVWV